MRWAALGLIVNAGPLGRLGRHGLCLGGGCQEGDERIADGLLHGSVVLPSNVMPLTAVLMMIPGRMNSRISV
jgi:hypothetical protein